MNPWLQAYLDTLVYHDKTFNALREIEDKLWSIYCALEALNSDVQVLLLRSRGDGLFCRSTTKQDQTLSGRSHSRPKKKLDVEL